MLLERVFTLEKCPGRELRQQLSSRLNVRPRQIQVPAVTAYGGHTMRRRNGLRLREGGAGQYARQRARSSDGSRHGA